VPGAANPQSWNRYSYVANNPVRYSDPSGHMMTEGCGAEGKSRCHASDLEIAINKQKEAPLKRDADEMRCRKGDYAHCAGIQGFQIQITLSAGLPTQLTNSQGSNVSPLIFYGISLVFDKHGGFQVYGLTRDVQFDPYYKPGPAENEYPMDYAGAGVTLAGGFIYGSEFAARGTSAYAGPSLDKTMGYGPVSVDHYDLFDEISGRIDGTKVSGDDLGYSIGTPVSGGSFAINSHPWFPRIGPTIQDPWAR
jgi:hypothetical protein